MNISARGAIVSDLALTTTANGKSVCNFTVKTSRGYKDENGEYVYDFNDFSIWGEKAQKMVEDFKKGDVVTIEASQTKQKNEKDGKTYTNIVNTVNNIEHYVAKEKEASVETKVNDMEM